MRKILVINYELILKWRFYIYNIYQFDIIYIDNIICITIIFYGCLFTFILIIKKKWL